MNQTTDEVIKKKRGTDFLDWVRNMASKLKHAWQPREVQNKTVKGTTFHNIKLVEKAVLMEQIAVYEDSPSEIKMEDLASNLTKT